MNTLVWLPGLTSVLALVFSVALFDQWRVRRHSFQLDLGPRDAVLRDRVRVRGDRWRVRLE